MKTLAFARLLLAPLAILAVSAAPLRLSAQNAATPALSSAERKIDLNIPEGRLSDAIKRLREKFPEWNFVCEPEIAHLKVSEIQLHSANAGSAASAVCRAMDKVAVETPQPGTTNASTFSFYYNLSLIDKQSNKNVQTGVEAFSLKDPQTEGSPSKEDVTERMLQIREMVSSTIGSIRQQGEIPVGEEPKFLTYPEANVLIAIGSRDGIEITRKIVNAFNEMHHDNGDADKENARHLKALASPSPTAALVPTPTSTH